MMEAEGKRGFPFAPSHAGREENQDEEDPRMEMCIRDSNKSRLGANAILGASLACAKAAAESLGVSLYLSLIPI